MSTELTIQQEELNEQRYKEAFKTKKTDQIDVIYDNENEDALQQFQEQEDKFIGIFNFKKFTLNRKFLNAQGKNVRLYYNKFVPKGEKKAQICIFHGFGEHSGRFLHIAQFFAENNIIVHLIDFRGFGYSGGPRGASTLEQMHQDIETVLKQCDLNIPTFLYGHSMGAQIILSFALRNSHINLAGIITTSALISFPKDRHLHWVSSFILRAIGKDIEDMVLNSKIHPTALTKDNHFIKNCFGDRMMLPFLGMNLAKCVIEGTLFVLPNAYKFKFPIFLIHGEKDVITNHQDSIRFYKECSSPHKKLKLFPNGYHELQHDQECNEMKNDVKNWILERSQSQILLT